MIALRALRPADDPALHAIFTDTDTRLWNPGPADDDIAAWRMRCAAEALAGTAYTWAVAGSDDCLLGIVSVYAMNLGDRHAEIGYRTLPAARGRGVARAGVALACVAVHAQGVIDRLVLFHAVENTASCSVAAACGFDLEAEIANSWTYGDGISHDEHRHVRRLGVVTREVVDGVAS